MGKIRKPGRALFHTYCCPKNTIRGRTFQARVVDVRTGFDIQCSSDTFDSAVACARQQVLAEKTARKAKSHKRGRRETG